MAAVARGIVLTRASFHLDVGHLLKAVELAESSDGLTAPHPKIRCVIARGQRIVGTGGLYAQGARSTELQAVEEARNTTAFQNLEPGDCDGDDAAVAALVQGGLKRVVIGIYELGLDCGPIQQ